MAGWDDFDFSDSGDIDFGGDDVDWSALAGAGDDFGDMVLDTFTGEMVDASSVDPNEIANRPGPERVRWSHRHLPERSAPLPRRRSHHAGHGAASTGTPWPIPRRPLRARAAASATG